jgi:hypothetical protein
MKAVIAIDVEFSCKKKCEITGVASKFAPHITIMPRFEVKYIDFEIEETAKHCVDLLRKHPTYFELIGPIKISRTLSWIEAMPEANGYDVLLELHSYCTKECPPSSQPEFCGKGYRPHLTTNWHTVNINLDKRLNKFEVRPTGVVIYTYANDPQYDDITSYIYRL